jgi:hypothetical protein
MPDERIEVTAYSGSRAEAIPRFFILHDEKIEVVSILARWLEEGVTERRRKRFFRVQGSDGYIHTLYYDETENAWFLGKTG